MASPKQAYQVTVGDPAGRVERIGRGLGWASTYSLLRPPSLNVCGSDPHATNEKHSTGRQLERRTESWLGANGPEILYACAIS